MAYYAFSMVCLYAVYVVCFNLRSYTISVGKTLRTSFRGDADYHDYSGLIHLHTDYSNDAMGSYEELAEIAAKQSLDFLMVTDHNNLRALADGKEGWYGRTLVLTGVESTRQEGYLVAFDIPAYATRRADPTGCFLDEIGRMGGFVLIVHSENSRRTWRGEVDERIAGLEVLDYSDLLYDCSLFAKVCAALFYLTNRELAYLTIYYRPAATLARWDREARARPFVGFYGPNSHQAVRVFGRRYKFPKAEEVMPLVHNHLLSRERLTGDFHTDKRILYGALRAGHLFFSLDLIGNARGFMFSARQGNDAAIMGDTLPAGRDTFFEVRLPDITGGKDIRIVVYRDGEEFMRSKARKLEFVASAAGVYRIEVLARVPTLLGFGRVVPWIYSNPIYLR